MTNIAAEVREELEHDLISHGLLLQFLRDGNCPEQIDESAAAHLLAELLAHGDIEIGVAQLTDRDYVEFVGWKGSISERITRAMMNVAQASPDDKEFAYWIAFSRNVDRFENTPELAE